MTDLSELIQSYYYDPKLGANLVKMVEEKNLWSEVDPNDPDPNNYRCQQLKLGCHEELKDFEEQFLLLFRDVVARYNSVVRTIVTGDTGFTLLKYRPGDECTVHCDLVPHEVRVCTAIYYINDDYEGGELFFPNQNITMKPQPGQVVMIPATEEFPHLVKPVTKGDRYVLRCFYVCRVENPLAV